MSKPRHTAQRAGWPCDTQGTRMTRVWRRIGWSLSLVGLLLSCSSQPSPQQVLAPNTPALEQLYQDGRLAFQQQRYPAAAAAFARVVATDPMHVKARLNWAAALSYTNKPAEAIVQCQNVLARDPTNAEAYYQWGAVLVRAGQHQEALEKFDQALTLKPLSELLPDDPRQRQALQDYIKRQRRQLSDAEIVRPKSESSRQDPGRMPPKR